MIIYDSIYNLIEQYIFGTLTSGSVQELATVLCALAISLICIALPFLIVWKVINIIMGG